MRVVVSNSTSLVRQLSRGNPMLRWYVVHSSILRPFANLDTMCRQICRQIQACTHSFSA